MEKLNLLDIHDAIAKGKQSPSPLTGDVTVSVLDSVERAGGMLSSATELGTLTLGKPLRTVVVGEDDALKTCTMCSYNFSFNALKLDETKSQAILSSLQSFMENPEFLME